MWFYKRRWVRAISGGLVLCLLLSIGGVYGQAEAVREEVVRLHILANSDSTADQTLKLQVRDAVTAAAANWRADTPAEARRLAQEQLAYIEEVARQTVRAAGCADAVAAEYTQLYFTTRQYGATTLPAGVYDAVQVTIGEGKGQNWWCVMYPPMCVGGAVAQDSLSPATQGEPYILRFKVVEWVESFLQLFRRKNF